MAESRSRRPTRQKRRTSVSNDKDPRLSRRDRSRRKLVPKWDKKSRLLLLGNIVVKRFRRRAPIAELILSAFEEQGWAISIDDPLPPIPGRHEAGRLRNELAKMNRGLDRNVIHFTMDGTGERVCWERTTRGVISRVLWLSCLAHGHIEIWYQCPFL